MVCVYCGSPTQVVNSRLQRRDDHIWRRRKCADCGGIFTTREHAEFHSAFMVDKQGVIKPFSRDLLFVSIYDSCKHRPTALEDATALTGIVTAQTLKKHSAGVVNRDDIARAAHLALKRFDNAAATFYAAYHRIS